MKTYYLKILYPSSGKFYKTEIKATRLKCGEGCYKFFIDDNLKACYPIQYTIILNIQDEN